MSPDTKEVALEVRRLSKSFQLSDETWLEALSGITFSVMSGDFVSIVGPSGCGKTTFLEILAGLQRSSSGEVSISHAAESNPQRSKPVMVFQDYTRSLLPFLTVRRNVRFAVAPLSLGTSEASERVAQAIALTGLEEFAEYNTWQLSGGMQQRVALARALATRASILLLDEPFGSVDRQTEYILEDELLAISERTALTIIYVTHDLDSAVYCSKRVIVLTRRPGRLLLDIPIDLPFPRQQDTTRSSPLFVEYRTRLYHLLKDESDKTGNV